ncbi:MAG: type II secretion system protein, partial [Pantoea agglomerans]
MKTAHLRGFTLPELLLVMVIAGMLSVAALHGWQRWQQRQQLRD